MDVKKTATDTAYIVVGVGVLGFQQAQVRRRDAIARVDSLRREARVALSDQAGRIKARTGGCAGQLGDRSRTFGSSVGATVGTTVSNAAGAVGTTVGSAADAVGTQVRAGAEVARNADPRAWVDPVVGEVKVRVEPVVGQLRTISLPERVTALPEQVSKALEVGRNQVQGRLGAVTPPRLRSAASG